MLGQTQAGEGAGYEIGPIRPPSEAHSLLIRATRNCPWNRCQFCGTYKGEKFELRPVNEILNDIQAARSMCDRITEYAFQNGLADRLDQAAAAVYRQSGSSDNLSNIAMWLLAGGQSAFLQDANSLVMPTADLVTVLKALKETFPVLTRITSYARSKTVAKKTPEEMAELRKAGLTRIHIGVESGCDEVLAYIDKGATAEDHIRGGRNVMKAGIELSLYIMPGIGGRQWTKEHSSDTASMLNDINPDFIRLRSFHPRLETPIRSRVDSGEFELLSEDEVVAEIGRLIRGLNVTGELKSDHIINLLPEIEGKLPEAKTKMLAAVDSYLSLPEDDRLHFRLGRRAGYYENLSDMVDPQKRKMVQDLRIRIGAGTSAEIDRVSTRLKNAFF